MRTPARCRPVLTILLAGVLAATPAWADKEDKGGKHADKQSEKAHKKADKEDEKARKHEDKQARKAGKDPHDEVRVGGHFDDRHRSFARNYYHEHFGDARGCPPGLAKKNNGCMPPGQAKKYNVGRPLPREVVYYPVPQPVLVQLPAVPRGYRYVRVGNDILLLSPESALVVDVIINIFG